MQSGAWGQPRPGRLRHRALRTHQPASGKAPVPEDVCRICWEGGDPGSSSELLTGTCSCAGSLAHVHAHCLLQWQRLARDPSTCATCKGPVCIPPGVAAKVRLAPRWAAWAEHELGRLRDRPAKTLLKWWNQAVAAIGLLHAAHCTQRAWTAAPGITVHLRELPLRQGRWHTLVGLAAVALYQRVWLPWLRVPQRVVGMHALCYAAGVALDAGALWVVEAVAGWGGAAATAGSWLCKIAAFAGIALQVSAIQHLHPLHQFVSGYTHGVTKACAFTGGLLLGVARAALRLLGSGGSGGVARLLAGAARALPFFLHAFSHSLAVAGHLRF